MKKITKTAKYIIPLSLTFIFGVAFASLNQEVVISGKSTVTYVPTPNLIFDHTSTVTPGADSWFGRWMNHDISMTISNTGDGESERWEFNLQIPNDAEDITCWGSVCTKVGTTLNIKNDVYNAIIFPGENTTGGISFRTRDTNYVPEEPEPEDPTIINYGENVAVVINRTSSSGWFRVTANYDMIVTNNNDVPINWWSFEIDNSPGFTVNSVTNASFVNSTGSLKILNNTQNGTLQPGTSVTAQVSVTNWWSAPVLTPALIKAGID